jgi:hypothetical protein
MRESLKAVKAHFISPPPPSYCEFNSISLAFKLARSDGGEGEEEGCQYLQMHAFE